jgi:hypothetical protein
MLCGMSTTQQATHPLTVPATVAGGVTVALALLAIAGGPGLGWLLATVAVLVGVAAITLGHMAQAKVGLILGYAGLGIVFVTFAAQYIAAQF